MDSRHLYKANADAFSLWLDSGRAIADEAGKTGENARNVRGLLEEEDQFRVIERLIAHLPIPVISRIYHTPPRLAWRSLFLPSRARREYLLLKYAFKRGLPVIEPLAWSETRAWGCPVYSQLTLVPAEGLPLPEAVQDPRMTDALLQQVARQLGVLLARMHAAGMVWMSAYARNVLVEFDQDARPKLQVIDFPYARCSQDSQLGSSYALTDLWWMRWTCVRDCGFVSGQVEQLIQAYAQEAGIDAGTLSRQVAKRKKMTCTLNRMVYRTLQAFALHS